MFKKNKNSAMNYNGTGLKELLSIIGALLLVALAIAIFSGCVTTQSAREYAEYRYQEGRATELRICNDRYEKLQKSFQELKADFEKFLEGSFQKIVPDNKGHLYLDNPVEREELKTGEFNIDRIYETPKK